MGMCSTFANTERPATEKRSTRWRSNRRSTPARRRAADACCCTAGTFLTRTIHLKSNVTLFIEAGAVLQGTATLDDYEDIKPTYASYTYSHRSFIYADHADNVSILGKGAIDLRGRDFPPPPRKHDPGSLEWGLSPFCVHLVQCNHLTIRDITIRNCPMAALRVLACDDVVIEGITIDSRVRISCDGIEIVSSQHVRVANCRVNSWDDAVCLKSSSLDFCRNVTITNCSITSLCNAIKFGTESSGGFENITIDNCTIEGALMGGSRSITGLALEIVDGGTMNQVVISNITVRAVRTAIFIHLGNRARLYAPDIPKPGIGVLKNVFISNIQAETIDGEHCSSITGEPDHPVENIVLDNIRVRFPGGGTAESAAREIPEKPVQYPESTMFGALPAFGFYCRHAKGVKFRNVQCGLEKADARPALVCDDVDGLEISALETPDCTGDSIIRLRQTRRALVRECRPVAEAGSFLHVEGDQTADIVLMSNDLRRVKAAVTKGGGFVGDVAEAGNLAGK